MAELVYPPIIRVAMGLFRGLSLKIDVRGEENVPATGGGVVVINHLSYLDFALSGVPFWYSRKRLVRFMAKQDVFRHPVSGPLMRGMHHIPVDRSAGAASYQAAVDALRSGELVGVFPETTISRSYCLMPFKSGAARMAVEADVPVIPVTLWGSQRTLTKGRKRDLKAARGVPIAITVGRPVPPNDLKEPQSGTRLLFEVMDGQLADTQKRYPAPADPATTWWLPAHLGGAAPTPEQVAAEDARRS